VAVGALYAELRAELHACCTGVSEERAGQRPTVDAWSVKETLAHLIACERDLQTWLAGSILDIERAEDLEGRPNVAARLSALTATYGSLPALLDALWRSMDETVALLAALPDAFVARAYQYRRAASFWARTNIPAHTREHIEAICAALATL
jgi:hypothetical protein